MRIGFNHRTRCLVVRSYDDPLAGGVVAQAAQRVAAAAEAVDTVPPVNTRTLAVVRTVALDIVDNLRAEILAAELTMEDLG